MDGILSLTKYFWQKFLITIPIGYFVLNEQHFLVIYSLAMVIMIDSFLGIWVAVKHRVFTSHKLSRISNKIGRYSLALASIWVLSCMQPTLFGWTFQYIGVFFVLTEIFSNFEKLSLLGLKLPTKFLAKINDNFRKYYDGSDDEKEEALCNILNKQNCIKK